MAYWKISPIPCAKGGSTDSLFMTILVSFSDTGLSEVALLAFRISLYGSSNSRTNVNPCVADNVTTTFWGKSALVNHLPIRKKTHHHSSDQEQDAKTQWEMNDLPENSSSLTRMVVLVESPKQERVQQE